MSRPYRKTLVALCAAALTVTTVAAGAAPSAAAPPTGSPGGPPPAAALREALDAITAAGMPGTFAEVRDGRHRWRGASGVADVGTGRPVRPGFQHRVGSVTKTFVATAVLQLVGEKRLALDAPVTRYLPGLAPPGVTVRMLLNHTSGIGDYDTVLITSPEDFERYRYTTVTPRQLARIGLAAPRTGAPGEAWSYSNTNYILAGLLLERVTGRSAEREITRRIIRPLGLRQTYFPGTTTRIAGPHSEGYLPWDGGELRDFSVYNMSWAWMAGALVSSTGDLNRFFRALLAGRLLRPTELAQMRTTVPFDPAEPAAGGYGLGIYRAPLPCGQVWGHDGVVFGHSTISLHSPDGRRQVTVAGNLTHYQLPDQPDPIGGATIGFVVTALCGPPGTPAGARATAAAPSLRLPDHSSTPAPVPAAGAR